MQKFPDLAENFATTNLETVKEFIKERLNLPKEKADILILAGGGHEKFARYSGIKYEENTLYKDEASPIMMDIETRKKDQTHVDAERSKKPFVRMAFYYSFIFQFYHFPY